MAKSNSIKGREILSSKENFPEFSLLTYDASLSKNLNFYSAEILDNKLKKEWTLLCWRSQKKDISKVKRISDGFFSAIGAVAHMISVRQIPLHENELAFLNKKYHEFNKLAPDEVQESVSHTISKDDANDREFSTHMAEFEYGVDSFFRGQLFDGKSYLIKNNVKSSINSRIAAGLKPKVKELQLALSCKDEQLSEGYSFLSRRELVKLIAHVQGLIDSCETASAITKALRKPRAKKVKPPSEVVKDVKYMLEDTATNLKSDHPSKIIKSTEVWLYNVKNRRLFRYTALPNMQLNVKGTTIINVDHAKSSGKIIRKPEKLLLGIQNLTSRPLNKLFNEIRGAETKATGRLNEESIIVKCIH